MQLEQGVCVTELRHYLQFMPVNGEAVQCVEW